MIRPKYQIEKLHKKVYTKSDTCREAMWVYHRPTAPVNHPNVKMVTPTMENKKP
jgi:hypothetical protein